MEFLRHSRRTAFSSSVSWSNRYIVHLNTQTILASSPGPSQRIGRGLGTRLKLYSLHGSIVSQASPFTDYGSMHTLQTHISTHIFAHSNTRPTLRGAGLLTGSVPPCCESWPSRPEVDEEESIPQTLLASTFDLSGAFGQGR